MTNVGAAAESAGMKPCWSNARKGYEWALGAIEGAEKLPLRELLPLIRDKMDSAAATLPEAKADELYKLRKSLPESPETFGRYLRSAGIKMYNSAGDRIGRFPRRDQI